MNINKDSVQKILSKNLRAKISHHMKRTLQVMFWWYSEVNWPSPEHILTDSHLWIILDLLIWSWGHTTVSALENVAITKNWINMSIFKRQVSNIFFHKDPLFVMISQISCKCFYIQLESSCISSNTNTSRKLEFGNCVGSIVNSLC